MESIKPVPIPESLHAKVQKIARDRKMTLKALVVEILTNEVSK